VAAGDEEPVRIDKWLWAARFVKTRALAVEAVKGGRVHVNGQRVKPAREVAIGDEVEYVLGPMRRTVVVRAISRHRGPASEAAQLYAETPESVARGEELAVQRRIERAIAGDRGGRPTKRDRRRYESERRRRREDD
jgi:ribosome-associated heat shock protein Hsp15